MNTKSKGITLAAGAASLWAFSGVSGQALFSQFGISSSWLVSVRLIISGLLLLAFAGIVRKEKLVEPLLHKRDLGHLLVFSLLGMFAVQFTYFKTIELSTASFATILQYAAPFFVVIYEAFEKRKVPSMWSICLLIGTLVGVVLMASKGDIHNLTGSNEALLWGISSTMALAFYFLYPRKLLLKYGSPRIVGWAMLIASVLAFVIHPMWAITGEFTSIAFIHLFVVVVLGTTLANVLFLSSLRYITASLAGVLTAFEPILATLISLVMFQLQLGVIEWSGFVLVIVSILLLQKEM